MDRKTMRLRICPLNTESSHDKPVVIDEKIVNKFKKDILGTPLLYADEGDGSLPKYHKDKNGQRKIIGSAIGSDIVTDENGVQYFVGDYLLYEEQHKDIIDSLKRHEDNLGTSYEVFSEMFDNSTGKILDGEFKGLSVLDKDNSAYKHHALLVASRTETRDEKESEEMEIKYDDILKGLVGNDYQSKLTDKDKNIEELKNKLKSLEEKQEILHSTKVKQLQNQLEVVLEENQRLRELNENIVELN